MRLIRLLCLPILITGLALFTSAQEDEKWYYGWNPADEQVFAYTANGDTRVLLEAGFDEVTHLRRIDRRNAVGVVARGIQGDPQIYFLTPDEARLITPTFDPQILEDLEPTYYLHAFNDQYAVFASTYDMGGATGFLADFNTGTLDLLGEDKIILNVGSTHFSEDGAFLRYISLDDSGEDRVWSLRERTLATGEERIIYSGEGYPVVRGGRFGEHWLVYEAHQVEGNWIRTFLLLDTMGNSEIVAESTQDNQVIARMVGDHVAVFPVNCSLNCPITLISLSERNERTFNAPPGDDVQNPLEVPDAEHLLVLNDDTLYVLEEAAEPVSIGGYFPQNLGQQLQQLFSPDKRYMLVLTLDEAGEPEGYGVWDFASERLVVDNVPEGYLFVLIYYSDSGFIVTEGLQKFYLYRYADEKLIELPEEADYCFEVLSDGDVLCNVGPEDEGISPGIYRYNSVNGELTLLVENGRALAP